MDYVDFNLPASYGFFICLQFDDLFSVFEPWFVQCSATKGEGKSKKACDAMLNTSQKVRNFEKPI